MTFKKYTTLVPPKVEGQASHVAFVIHGIGQQTEQYGFFQKHLESLHNTTQEAVNAHSSETQATVQYIPIEWHRHIHEATDDMMDDITMTSIPHLRMVNNDYLADAFFYLAEDRHRAIVKHVTATFNSAYRAFRQENPHFGGKIAIMAYSLGGIITWDILSTQKDNPTLAFKPDFLFNLGSPLSAFMTVRNQSPETYHPDESIVFENIFHPYDPLAYRFEPLLKSDYKQKPAVMVDRCYEGGGNALQKVVDWYNMSLQHTCKGTFLSFITNNKSKKRARSACVSESGDSKRRRVVLNATCTKGKRIKSTGMLKGRIDYCLQPDRIWDAIPYLGGLSAHFSYWQNSDLLWHIVKRMDDVKPAPIECVIKA